MSADVLSLMNALVSITRPTNAQDTSGQPTAARTTVYSNIPCSMQQNTSGQQVIYDGDRNRYTGRSIFTTQADIREGDWIVWGSRTFEVVGVDAEYDHNGMVSHYTVEWVETK